MSTLVVAAGCSSGNTSSDQTSPERATVPQQAQQGGESGGSESIPAIVRQVEPSVVAVLGANGEGSGVIWDSGGHIITNNHVVAGLEQGPGPADIEVAFADGTRVPAKAVAADPLTDLAILKVDRSNLPPATFAEKLPQVGELAIAMGNPLGFENSVTAGIVSGLHRSIPGSAPESQSLIDLIQTDAAISPGNSGGALVDAAGEVMGINVAFIPPEARAVSIGFAIPSATVVDVVKQLLDHGTVKHAFFGVQPAQLTDQIARQLHVDANEGVVVLDVVDGGPAAKAGIKAGDVITGIDGKTVPTVEDFLAALRERAPGDEVKVQVSRGSEQLDLTVTLADRPPGD